MDAEEAKIIRDMLSLVVEYFDELRGDLGTVAFYDMLARKLSRIVRKEPAWTWRYVQGVHAGSIGPSKLFASAVNAVGAVLDEVPAALSYTVEVRVLAPPGLVQAGSLLLGTSRECARPGCRVVFVPRVPWGKYCSSECCALNNADKGRKGLHENK